MRGLTATLSCLAALAMAAPAAAQTAQNIGQHNAWATYAYQGDEGRVCYVLTVPTEKQPASLNHGDVYFFVSQKPGASPTYQPQFRASYDFQNNSRVRVTVGDQTYNMFTRGGWAWMESPDQEPQLVAAMRGGANMRVQAVSGRGNETNYTFSLQGITAALNSISSCD